MALSKIDDRGLNTPIDLLDNEKLRLGTGNDLQIYHDGSQSYLVNNTSDLYIQCAGDENAIETNQNGAVKLYYDGTKKLETTSTGATVSGDDLLLSGGGHSKLKLVTTGTGHATGIQITHASGAGAQQIWQLQTDGTADGDLKLRNSTAGQDVFYVQPDSNLRFQDNRKLLIGSSGDLEIYHDGSHSFIQNGTGDLVLYAASGSIKLLKTSGAESMLHAAVDGAVDLYYDNSKKFETTSAGATVTGTLTASGTGGGAAALGSHLDLGDNQKVRLGSSDDLQIFHDGSNSIINDSGTGSLRIQTDGSNQWEFNGAIFKGNDGRAVVLGDSSDLEIFHSSDTNYFNSKNGMNVTFVNDKDGGNENMVLMSPNGAVNLYHNGTLSVSTHSKGIAFNDSTDSQEIWFSDSNNADEGKIVYDHTDDSMRFHAWGGERMRIRSNGTWRVSTDVSDSAHWASSDYHTIHSNDSTIALAVENSHDTSPYALLLKFSDDSPDNNSNYFIKCEDSSANRFFVYSDGDGWNHDSSWSSSDATLKENIVDVSSKLEDIKKLKVRNFNWKADYFPEKSKKKMIGFIAQEVEEVFPALVSEHNVAPDGKEKVMKKAIKQAWDPIIIKALQEAIAKIETLETKVAALEAA